MLLLILIIGVVSYAWTYTTYKNLVHVYAARRVYPFLFQAAVAVVPAEVVIVPSPHDGARAEVLVEPRGRENSALAGRRAHVVQEHVVLGIANHRLKPAWRGIGGGELGARVMETSTK